ncbi:MAG: zf-HC2 domain-containing protein [Proteobacteria bacterium]|nr:zf-HC2 domain-containing protein [Pseudomonadota bacterium]
MDCKGVKRRLSAYVDGEVEQQERKNIAHHVNSCPDCTREMKALQDTCLLISEDSGVEPSPDFLLQLFERVKVEQEKVSLVRRKGWSFTSLPAFARVAVLLVLGIVIGAGLGTLTSFEKQAAIGLRPDKNLAIEANLQNFQSVYPQSLTQVYLNLSSSFKS